MRNYFFVLLSCMAPFSAGAREYNRLNPLAGSTVLYEVQVRSANACRTDTGSHEQRAACERKIAPKIEYKAYNGNRAQCGSALNYLEQIKLGTLEDMTENTSDYHLGITLRYIKEKVGANMIWIMPIFPNNDRWSLPHPCDNIGSPYAVRDYMHTQGKLARACIQQDRDENSGEDNHGAPCWGNFAMDELIRKAHEMGLKVMLDVAFNHFGHNYLYYDYANYLPVREKLLSGQNLEGLWDYGHNFEQELVHPEILDSEEKLRSASGSSGALRKALSEISSRCPGLKGDHLVRAVNMWREMMDWERAQLRCDMPVYLEHYAPGFYLGQREGSFPKPSNGLGDNFTNNWVDVKFLYHHEYHRNDGHRGDYYNVFARNREYLFRVMNYWVSRGIDGFRLDHASDHDSGLSANIWKYIIGKVNYYDWVRKGRPANHIPPIYMAEEFGDQMAMKHVVDAMTEGYVGDIRGGDGAVKNASYVEGVLEKDGRFDNHTHVLRALETHDESRVNGNKHHGFNMWTAAGFWGIGAASRGMPMLLMGQEFGETAALEFRRSDFVRARFYGTPNHVSNGWELVDFYGKMNRARLAHENRALRSEKRYYLRTRDPKHGAHADPRIFAQAKWTEDNVVFTFFNLWETPEPSVKQSYYISPELARAAHIQDHLAYRLVNALDGKQEGRCTLGKDLKWDLYIEMRRDERLQWLRLELCR